MKYQLTSTKTTCGRSLFYVATWASDPVLQGCNSGGAWPSRGAMRTVNTSEGEQRSSKCSRYQLNIALCSSVWYSSDKLRQKLL